MKENKRIYYIPVIELMGIVIGVVISIMCGYNLGLGISLGWALGTLIGSVVVFILYKTQDNAGETKYTTFSDECEQKIQN